MRPAAHHFGDVFGVYFFFEHHLGGLDFCEVLRGGGDFGFHFWDAGEAYLGCASQIARTGEGFGVRAGFVQGFFEVADAADGGFLGFPVGLEARKLFA